MQNINWRQVLVFGLVVLVVFVLGFGVLLLLLGGGSGVMGSGMIGPGGMRGGWCPWCGGTGRLGGGLLGSILGLTLSCLLPLALLVLLVVGGVWLARNVSSRTPHPSATRCPTCDRAVEPGWQVCPYCGEDLQNE
jgi:hypothetical protein